jgi:hypothetical protein
VRRTGKYLVIAGIVLVVVGIPSMAIGWLTIDVPVPETWFLIVGAPMTAFGIFLLVVGAALRVLSSVRS